MQALDSSVLASISAAQIDQYATSRGWRPTSKSPPNTRLYNHKSKGLEQLLVPLSATAPDYERRIRDVLTTLSEVEERSPLVIASDILSVDTDVLRIRLSCPSTSNGSAKLNDAIQLIEGAKRLILSAAAIANSPSISHSRIDSGLGHELVDQCRLGQTERGSYVITIQCPLYATEHPQMLLPSLDPFSRKTLRSLMSGVSRLRSVAEAGFTKQPVQSELLVSTNMCESLLMMEPSEPDAALDIGVAWAGAIDLELPSLSQVTLRKVDFESIEKVLEELRPATPPKESVFVGRIDSLSTNHHETTEGEAGVKLMSDEPVTAARIRLTGADWDTAHAALKADGLVVFKGILKIGGKVNRIESITNFARVTS